MKSISSATRLPLAETTTKFLRMNVLSGIRSLARRTLWRSAKSSFLAPNLQGLWGQPRLSLRYYASNPDTTRDSALRPTTHHRAPEFHIRAPKALGRSQLALVAGFVFLLKGSCMRAALQLESWS